MGLISKRLKTLEWLSFNSLMHYLNDVDRFNSLDESFQSKTALCIILSIADEFWLRRIFSLVKVELSSTMSESRSSLI